MATGDIVAFNLLGVSGSMRLGSYSLKALTMVLESAASHSAQTKLLDLRTADLPMFSPDRDEHAASVIEATAMVTWADAFVLACPDYHGSMSGAIKNFLDYHWEELAGKLFGYLVSSHEKGLTVMDQMRTAVRQCYGWSLPYGVSLHGEQDFDEAGKPSATLDERLRMLARDVMVYGAMLRQQFQADIEQSVADSFASRYGNQS
jgi:FMN reductase